MLVSSRLLYSSLINRARTVALAKLPLPRPTVAIATAVTSWPSGQLQQPKQREEALRITSRDRLSIICSTLLLFLHASIGFNGPR
jgi:hypothetical protein